MVLKKAIAKKIIRSPTFRNVVRFGVKLVITEKFLKEHKYIRKVVKYI